MRILALDLGRQTGWAFGTQRGVVENSSVKIFSWDRATPLGHRLVHFRDWLRNCAAGYQPEVIVYEAPIHRGGPTTIILKSLAAVVELEAAAAGRDCFSVNLQTIKKHATGKGTGRGKDGLIAFASKLVKQPLPHHDQADAICLLDFAFSLPAIPRTA